jgi:hypothetical protein
LNEKQLYEYLKENLKINVKRVEGSYGDKGFSELQLILKGEIISSDYIED